MKIPGWLAHSPASLLLLEHGAVIGASEAACRELRCCLPELRGGGFLESLDPDDRGAFDRAVEQVGARPPTEAAGAPLHVRRPRRSESNGSGPDTIDVLEVRLARCKEGVLADVRDITELRRVDRILNALSTAIFVTDATGSVIWRSATYLAQFDDGADVVNALSWIHPDDLPDALNGFASMLSEPGVCHVDQYRVRRPHVDNAWNTARLTAVNLLGDPVIGGIVIRSENETEEWVESIGRTASGFHSLAESAPIGIVVADPNGLSVYSNRLAEEFLGLSGTKPDRADWTAGMRAGDRAAIELIMSDALERQTSGSTVVTIDRQNGAVIWVRVDVLPKLNEAGESFGLIATLLDVTSETVAQQSLEGAQEQLWRLANHDSLTGLPNRMQFNVRLERAFARRQGDGQAVAVLFCDLDNFKPVNDNYGHHVGDALLIEIARRLDSTTRELDSVFRIGGDEFVVICEGFGDLAGLEGLAKRLIESVGRPVRVGDVTVQVGLSIGIAEATPGATGDSLLARADTALYRAKHSGRNRSSLAD